MEHDFSTEFQGELRQSIVATFNDSELRNLCADLGVDYESLGGEGKESKARELITYQKRRGKLANLLFYCIKARPSYGWPQQNVPEPASKVTILFLASDPTDLSRLRLGEELREIHEKLRLAKTRDRFDLQQRMCVRPTDLGQALLDVNPQIVHFSCHSTANSFLGLENCTGTAQFVGFDAVAALFKQFAGQVYCVVLNACYSEALARAIAHHVPYVIGMTQRISDKAAIAFSVGFYQALGAGRTIESAYQLGCVGIQLHGVAEHLVPVLVQRGQVRSD